MLTRTFPAQTLRPFTRCLQDYVLAGGKRIRPQLCLWTYAQASGERGEAPDCVLDLASVWELFHAFLLAHDDIIDRADFRRDQPSLHHQLAALDSNCSTFGTNLGIVAGDLLFGMAIRVLHEIDLPDASYRPVLQLFSRIACMTGFGQAIDIWQTHLPIDNVDEESLLLEYHWKTAAYTFEGPMLAGAMAGGLDESGQAVISRFALALGQAYQIHNDLLDLQTPAREGCDLVEGKRTLTLLRARAGMETSARRTFDTKLSSVRAANGRAIALAEELRQELHASGATRETQKMVASFQQAARDAASDSSLAPSLSAAMNQLLDTLESQYFATRVAVHA